MAAMATTTPLVARDRLLPKSAVPSIGSGKGKGKVNGNITNFFKRADSTSSNRLLTSGDHEEALFLDSSPTKKPYQHITQTPTPPRDKSYSGESPNEVDATPTDSSSIRYNESESPVKRRRADSHDALRPTTVGTNAQRRGPFLDESDEEQGSGNEAQEDKMKVETLGSTQPSTVIREAARTPVDARDVVDAGVDQESIERETESRKPPVLKKEATSIGDEFEGLDDFIDDEFPEDGEEYMERRWMEEQADFESGLADDDEGQVDAALDEAQGDDQAEVALDPQTNDHPSCPICGGNTQGLTEDQASIHVNDCLDGKAKPLPANGTEAVITPKASTVKSESGIPAHKRFQRAAIARPGQINPISMTAKPSISSTAFSKLMSGHAEDAAWASAAATEMASRGKPAYQRTCPFYKIMPGLFICVDAFRYGAVEGCKAYFLSHFHSDHYIGLTSSWCHGPIYCSHVTANLVRRQLRVDPKWVIDLEFDVKIEVPNTQGVDVTMIPANHCPGSSLYLFEKTTGKGKTPKVQRILHCGDFRACPAHVQHPKLRPDIVDSVTKRNIAQQKIDVCYLDTTYLTPKYAFPSQTEVIQACADMCVSLSKDYVDETDSWEQTKKERAGTGMVKFVRKSSVKGEPDEKDVKIKLEDAPAEGDRKARGRLLVIVGTYSIGKERICLGVARALKSKIYAPPNKQKIVAALEDPELSALMTDNPYEAQVHMQMLMEIRAETLADYLTGFKPHFSRIVGFRPSGWNYRPPNSRFTESPSVQTVLHSDNWKSRYSMAELVPQRGSTREAHCFGVPYSEHSSFRELSMFCCALRIDKIIPTVNVGSAKSREKMKGWCEKWAMDKKKNGLYRVEDGRTAW